MLRPRVVFALSIAILLVGGATLYRFVSALPTSNTELVAISDQAPTTKENAAVPAASETGSVADSVDSNGNTTDLISRQLLSDYLNLASQGQNTDQGIASLADKYADSIVTLNTASISASGELKVVPDSKDNLQAYGKTLSASYNKYHDLTASTVKNGGGFSDLESPAFASTMKSLSILFRQSAVELQAMPVPASLSTLHSKLIKNFLSSSSQFVALSNVNTDSTGAFGALAAQASNSTEQTEILGQIQTTLLANSVFFSYQ
ncbi:MAG: hypothetical protein JWL80_181 [Parcubacteria group bacterium]|nr:hypothetical protein [Parcubacteria group bacterium]